MLGIGLGLMAILCLAGMIAGGGLFMHHEWKQKEHQDHQVTQRDYDHGQAVETSPERLPEDQKTIGLGP
jgi:hypothetical protein